MLPDVSGLYPRLTARENIHYFGELQGLSGAALASRTDALLGQLDMRAIADRRTAGFSHGERTKVSIARALVHDPPNVLLDEPTNGLDVMSTRAVREIIRRLRAEGRSVVFSSHVMQEVSALCDTIIVMARGRIVAAGTASELLREQTGKPDPRGRVRGPDRREPEGRGMSVRRQVVVVARKELRDAFRDRRAIYSVLFGSLFGPALVGFMFNAIADRQREIEDINLPVVGIDHAPALVAWLRQQSGVTVVEGPSDAESGGARAARRRRGGDSRGLREEVPGLLSSRCATSSPTDRATASRPKVQRVRALLQRYSGEMAALRLIGRGVSPAVVTPIRFRIGRSRARSSAPRSSSTSSRSSSSWPRSLGACRSRPTRRRASASADRSSRSS